MNWAWGAGRFLQAGKMSFNSKCGGWIIDPLLHPVRLNHPRLLSHSGNIAPGAPHQIQSRWHRIILVWAGNAFAWRNRLSQSIDAFWAQGTKMCIQVGQKEADNVFSHLHRWESSGKLISHIHFSKMSLGVGEHKRPLCSRCERASRGV